jgi:hypothetical protein
LMSLASFNFGFIRAERTSLMDSEELRHPK